MRTLSSSSGKNNLINDYLEFRKNSVGQIVKWQIPEPAASTEMFDEETTTRRRDFGSSLIIWTFGYADLLTWVREIS